MKSKEKLESRMLMSGGGGKMQMRRGDNNVHQRSRIYQTLRT